MLLSVARPLLFLLSGPNKEPDVRKRGGMKSKTFAILAITTLAMAGAPIIGWTDDKPDAETPMSTRGR